MPRIHLGTPREQTGRMNLYTDRQQGVYEIVGDDVHNALQWALEVIS